MGVVAAAVQYGGWVRLGSRRATQGSPEDRRQALSRWVVFAIVWQLLVLAFVGVYVLVMAQSPHPSAAWIAPVAGAVVGTALPLQLVVMRLLRSLT